jgi:uncharacterized coiled-coil DUF342 family protein
VRALDLKTLEQIANSQSVWAIIAFILAIFGYRTFSNYIQELKDESQQRENKLIELYEKQKIESKEREDKLMEHIQKTTETLDRIDRSLDQMGKDIDRSLDEMGKDIARVNMRIDEVWKKIGGTA